MPGWLDAELWNQAQLRESLYGPTPSERIQEEQKAWERIVAEHALAEADARQEAQRVVEERGMALFRELGADVAGVETGDGLMLLFDRIQDATHAGVLSERQRKDLTERVMRVGVSKRWLSPETAAPWLPGGR